MDFGNGLVNAAGFRAIAAIFSAGIRSVQPLAVAKMLAITAARTLGAFVRSPADPTLTITPGPPRAGAVRPRTRPAHPLHRMEEKQ